MYLGLVSLEILISIRLLLAQRFHFTVRIKPTVFPVASPFSSYYTHISCACLAFSFEKLPGLSGGFCAWLSPIIATLSLSHVKSNSY